MEDPEKANQLLLNEDRYISVKTHKYPHYLIMLSDVIVKGNLKLTEVKLVKTGEKIRRGI